MAAASLPQYYPTESEVCDCVIYNFYDNWGVDTTYDIPVPVSELEAPHVITIVVCPHSNPVMLMDANIYYVLDRSVSTTYYEYNALTYELTLMGD